MSLDIACKGYSGSAKIFGYSIPLTSYNYNQSYNYIHSSGIQKLYSDNKFTNYKKDYVIDFPLKKLDISFDAVENVIEKTIKHIEDNKNKTTNIKATFEDDIYKIDIAPEITRLSSFSLSVSENSLANASLGFLILDEEIELDISDFSKKKGASVPSWLGDEDLMPYYGFNVDFANFDEDSVVGFDFSWSQAGKPIYECNGNTNKNALAPAYYIWSIPESTINVSYFVGGDDFDHKNADFETDLTIKYGNNTLIKSKKVLVESITPKLGNSSSYVSFDVSGIIMEKITG